jgi:hypothetical protein
MNIQLLQDALARTRALRGRYPSHPPLDSVVSQLEYLIAIHEGGEESREKLLNLSIGVIAAREVEGIDDRLAEMLYDIAAEAKSGRI